MGTASTALSEKGYTKPFIGTFTYTTFMQKLEPVVLVSTLHEAKEFIIDPDPLVSSTGGYWLGLLSIVQYLSNAKNTVDKSRKKKNIK